MSEQPLYDVLIVGGGMVGASLAIGLSGHGLRIGLVEAHVPGDPGQPSYDDRGIALAQGSARIFAALGLWADLHQNAEPIHDIHVSDRGHFGFARLQAEQEQVNALGYVMTARELGYGLLGSLQACSDVEVIAPARVTAVKAGEGLAPAQVDVEQAGAALRLQARLLVAADGGQSFIREQLQLPTQRWAYGQSAVVSNISPEQPHKNVAYERFTDTGPVALLPMSEGRCALVWTVHDEQVESVMALDDEAFLSAFQERFGYRLGRFLRVGRRQSYPLSLLRVTEHSRPRVVVIGNAAHTLHPIAGQGFNLGLRDVAALTESVLEAHAQGADVGEAGVLAGYEGYRASEQRRVALATDALARVFSNPLPPVRMARNLGLLALDFLPPAKHGLARAAMGLTGRLPKLARGVARGD